MSFGVGVYFLTMLWFVSLMLCWVSVRTGHSIGKISVVVTLVITLILVCLPKGESFNLNVANFFDKLYIPRFAMIAFLSASGLLGATICFVHFWLVPVETRKVRNYGTDD